jgi:hypothetical protein
MAYEPHHTISQARLPVESHHAARGVIGRASPAVAEAAVYAGTAHFTHARATWPPRPKSNNADAARNAVSLLRGFACRANENRDNSGVRLKLQRCPRPVNVVNDREPRSIEITRPAESAVALIVRFGAVSLIAAKFAVPLASATNCDEEIVPVRRRFSAASKMP